MKVMPTLEKGLRIEVETATDWLVLEQIATDALEGGIETLPTRLSALMDEESEWDEIVVPELEDFFTGQLRVVRDTIHAAQQESTDPAEAAFHWPSATLPPNGMVH